MTILSKKSLSLKLNLEYRGVTEFLALTPPQKRHRSVVVYFQEFKTQELVLHSAWMKREIYCGDRRIYFIHDYPAETLAKKRRMCK